MSNRHAGSAVLYAMAVYKVFESQLLAYLLVYDVISD